MNDDYARAIRILSNDEINYRAVVVELAAQRPSIFLSLADAGNVWKNVDAYLRENQLINAIKAYRSHTGAGLREAKEAVEARRDALGLSRR